MARRLLHASSKYWRTRLRGRRWLTQPQTFLYLHLRWHLHLHPQQHLHPPLPPSPAALPSPSLAPSPAPLPFPPPGQHRHHHPHQSRTTCLLLASPLFFGPHAGSNVPSKLNDRRGLRQYTVRVPSGAGVAGQLLHRDWPICC
ncbi:hypothetical protein CTRI78_v009293 [Colletotrichum trifolii]|uniref:Uncharacterized protein n=1 Tax=Colletotrichum trifolii TaxID=5466 RepID=A0A4R8QR27_COLTR|nr:hypothetical protein CTRI78_v009293 [Colletotrichum trifolii]